MQPTIPCIDLLCFAVFEYERICPVFSDHMQQEGGQDDVVQSVGSDHDRY